MATLEKVSSVGFKDHEAESNLCMVQYFLRPVGNQRWQSFGRQPGSREFGSGSVQRCQVCTNECGGIGYETEKRQAVQAVPSVSWS